MKTFSFDAFKDKVMNDPEFLNELSTSEDVVDLESGLATIHRANLSKYFEEYFCRTEEDLSDILYYRYGVFARIVD